MKYTRLLIGLLWISICFFPCLLLAQHNPEIIAHEGEENALYFIFEWIEYIADIVGISILVLGFVKGIIVFFKMEFDNITGGDTFDDILALRSTLGGYIILSLDFLIISDIIHSVVKPELWELLNLAIIVVLRTSIGFFLGREIMELRHNRKMETDEEEHA
jgi:uncharacterized membrane protein